MSRKQSDMQTVEAAHTAKRTGRGGKYNFPCTIPPDSESKEDIQRVMADTLKWYERGEDRPTTDDGIMKRSTEYFTECMETGTRPTVEAYCLSLGYARQTVNEWKHGNNCSSARMDIIKRAYDVFATFDAGMAANNKLNPVLYFFRAKNYYDMRDQQDLIITPKRPLDGNIDAADVAAKYAELPAD